MHMPTVERKTLAQRSKSQATQPVASAANTIYHTRSPIMSNITARFTVPAALRMSIGALLLGMLLFFAAPPQPAAASCGGTTPVGDETELNNAIAAFNAETTTPCIFTIELSGDINLAASSTRIGNTISNVELVIDGDGHALDGQDNPGVLPLYVQPDTTVTLNNITITRGNSGHNGGGVFNRGDLTINNSAISDNLGPGEGGGIANAGTLVVNDSTITGNSVTGAIAFGGGIASGDMFDGSSLHPGNGTITINRSAITNNSAGSQGSAIAVESDMTSLTINNSTISGNTVVSGSGRAAILNWGSTLIINSSTIADNAGGTVSGIFTFNDTFTTPDSPGVTTVQNSIILHDGTPACGTVLGGSTVSAGHNLVSDLSCGFTATGDQQNTDPLLGSLANNGGPTFTHALLTGSPAIDAGDTPLTTDQRGSPRPAGGTDDIGAYETFSNKRVGTVVIKKSTAPNGGSGFTFGGDLGDFTLNDNGSKTVPNLAPGTYAVSENDPSGLNYELSGLTCVDGDPNGVASTQDVASRTATINLDPDETVICTFTNTEDDTITVEKVTIPASSDSFGFGGTLGAFNVGGGSVQDFTGLSAGQYTLSEDDPAPAGYALTGISCVDSASGQTFPGDLTSRSVDLNLTPGERVHCTFTNTKLGTVIIKKATAPGGGSGFSFGGDLGDFSLDDGGSKVVANLMPGSYAVSENDPSGSGYELSGLSCTDSDQGGRPSTGDVGSRTASINLDPGETVTCTFTNSEDDTITVEKVTVPASSDSFGFGGTLGAFNVGGGSVKDFTGLSAGQYTLSEDDPAPAGYALTGISCVDSASGQVFPGDLNSRSVDLNLTLGERVHCTFTNTQLGTVIIKKATAPGGGSGFSFGGDLGDFSLDDGGSKVVANLMPGSYAVSENDPSGSSYELSGLSCADSVKGGKRSSGDVGSRTASINLDPGETVTCTFTNSEDDTITVEKVTVPASSDSFGFDGGSLGAFSVAGGSVKDFTGLSAGQYTLSEDDPAPAGYALTGISCVDSATGQTFAGDLTTRSVDLTLAAGERVHCTFTNERIVLPTILRYFFPEMAQFDVLPPLFNMQ